jgi:hypothetical protein
MPTIIDQIVRYENGEMDEQETLELFDELIATGLAWTLQGCYGRMAQSLIERGLCQVPPRKEERQRGR